MDTASQAYLNTFRYEFSTSDKQPDTLTIFTEGTNLLLGETDQSKWHVTVVELAEETTSTMPFLPSDLNAVKNATVISSTTLTYGTHYTTKSNSGQKINN